MSIVRVVANLEWLDRVSAPGPGRVSGQRYTRGCSATAAGQRRARQERFLVVCVCLYRSSPINLMVKRYSSATAVP